MSASLILNLNGTWIWEIFDEDGEMYLRSAQRFSDREKAQKDLESASHLIRPYLMTA